MTATLALLRIELRLLGRDTTAWGTAIALPLLLGAVWFADLPPMGDGVGTAIVFQVVGLLVMTLHTVGTMSLVNRREQLVLKRWRSSEASTTGVLIGTIGVPAGLVVVQAAVLSVITMLAHGQAPASSTMLLVGVLSGVVTIGAVTFVVASFTRSSDHALITTFPVVALLMGGAVWAMMRPFDPLDWPVLAIPGGASVQLLRLGWDGPTQAGAGAAAWLGDAAASLGATALISLVATAAAVRVFRWEPRA